MKNHIFHNSEVFSIFHFFPLCYLRMRRLSTRNHQEIKKERIMDLSFPGDLPKEHHQVIMIQSILSSSHRLPSPYRYYFFLLIFFPNRHFLLIDFYHSLSLSLTFRRRGIFPLKVFHFLSFLLLLLLLLLLFLLLLLSSLSLLKTKMTFMKMCLGRRLSAEISVRVCRLPKSS